MQLLLLYNLNNGIILLFYYYLDKKIVFYKNISLTGVYNLV